MLLVVAAAAVHLPDKQAAHGASQYLLLQLLHQLILLPFPLPLLLLAVPAKPQLVLAKLQIL